MGQPPHQPYGQPYPYAFRHANPLDEMLKPAKRASVMMFVLGGLVLLFAGCMLLAALAFNSQQFMQQKEFQEILAKQEATVAQMTLGAVVLGTLTLIGALVMLVLGFFVRSGNFGVLLAAALVSLLPAGLCLLLVISGFVQGELAAGCMLFLPVPLFGLMEYWLVQGMSRSAHVQQWRAYLAHQAHGAAYGAPPLYATPGQYGQTYAQGYYTPPPPPPSSLPGPPKEPPASAS